MKFAEDFKCTYNMLKCNDNDNGECECADGSICKWKNGSGGDNCNTYIMILYLVLG